MKIIEINQLDNGAHRNQTVNNSFKIPDGWAAIPDNIIIPDTYPFVNIETNGQIVVSMTAKEIPEPEINLDLIKTEKILLSKTMLKMYLEEHPLTWVDNNQYSVTEEKQNLLASNLSLYQIAIAAEQPYELKWNTSGGVCTEWTYEDLSALALAIGAYVAPLVSYQQTKEVEIMACENIQDIDAIVINYNTIY